MKFMTFCFCLLCFLSGTVFAQNRSIGTLPLAKISGAKISGKSLKGTPEYAKALAVYEKLVAARGDMRSPVPKFKMTNDVAQVASMQYADNEIILEKKAYDICMEFGADAEAAMAFLLGHELTHFYEKHAWRSGFVSDFHDLKIRLKLDSLVDDTVNETEADYLGGFLAYSAGYGLFDKGGEVIKKLYEGYGMIKHDPLPGYPSLADRQAMSKRTAEKLELLVDVFDAANLLTAIGKYSDAYEFYHKVLMEYQSREIYNNLGVTLLLDIMKTHFTESELKYRYPIELDLQSSARKGSSGAGSVREALIGRALLHFEAAISLDPHYAPAYLNKACAYALLGGKENLERARFYAEKEAMPIAQTMDQYAKTLVDIKILQGIISATEGDMTTAKNMFTAAVKEDSSALAAINLKILNGEKLGTEKTTFGGGLARPERIDGQKMADLLNNLDYVDDKSIAVSSNFNLHQNPKQGDNSKAFLCEEVGAGKVTIFHLTGSGYDQASSRKIKRGADRDAITKAYGEPERTIETPLGQLLVYKATIFILHEEAGKKAVLDRWVNYGETEL